MTMRQRGWIPSADRAHRPADVAFLDTMQVAVDTPLVNPAFAAIGRVQAAPGAQQGTASRSHSTGAVHACPGSFTSDVVSLEVTT